ADEMTWASGLHAMPNKGWVVVLMVITANSLSLAQVTGDAEAPITTSTVEDSSNSSIEQPSADELEAGQPQDPELNNKDKDFVEYEPAPGDQITADDLVSFPIDI
ncbi:MAG: hypothetical protein VW202_06080, partial [Halieaceae bacterium]